MKTALIPLALFSVLTSQLAWAQNTAQPASAPAASAPATPPIEDFKPSTLNQAGRQYPMVNSERRARFRIVAPQAQSVRVDLGGGTVLTKDDSGAWVGTTRPLDEGFHYYQVNIDGAQVPDPGTRYFYGASRAGSGIEVPAKDQDFYAAKDVPHGETRQVLYFSKSTNALQRCFVYTPPGYEKNQSQRYGVLYLQHGAGEDETGWAVQGLTNLIMDNLIATGKSKPFIIVMANSYLNGIYGGAGGGRGGAPGAGRGPGGAGAPGAAPGGAASARGAGPGGGAPGRGTVNVGPFQTALIDELIPYIDQNYRTLPDASHRAMAGLSMGGMYTKSITLSHLDTFAYIALFSGGNIMPADIADLPAFKQKVKVVFMSYGSKESSAGRGGSTAPSGPVGAKNAADALTTAGVKAFSYVSPETAHEWLTWRRSLHEFAPLLFQE